MSDFLYILFRNGPVSLSRVHKLILYLFLKIILAPMALLEQLVYDRKIKRHQLTHPPVFILGHWRSGTTFVHGILARDPNRRYLNFYQATFPGIFLLTEKVFKPFLQMLVNRTGIKIPYFNNIPFDWNFPCEEDTALLNMNSPGSAYWAYVYPQKAEDWFEESLFAGDNNSKLLKCWRRDYLYLVKKLSYCHQGKPLILKSPPNTARIRHLLQLFPEARFIYIHRDPAEIYYSHKKLWQTNNKNFALQTIADHALEKIILDTLKKMSVACQRDSDLINPRNLFHLNYKSLMEDPFEEMKKLYTCLGLGNFDEALPHFQKFISRQHYRTFRYNYDPDKCKEIRDMFEEVKR